MTMILDPTIQSASEYIRLKKERNTREANRYFVPDRPDACPDCHARNSFWVKGYYFRWFVDGDVEEIFPVPRYICRWCHLVVSVLFAFLVPYRQFTKNVVAEGVEQYLSSRTTYRQVAGQIAGDGDEMQKPHHSQVWRWVGLLASRAAWRLNLALQRICVRLGKTAELLGLHEIVCSNSCRTQVAGKGRQLNSGSRLLALTKIIFEIKIDFVATLQTYLIDFLHPPLSILTGRAVRLLTPQSLQHLIH